MKTEDVYVIYATYNDCILSVHPSRELADARYKLINMGRKANADYLVVDLDTAINYLILAAKTEDEI